jgi:hypothetical protein
MNGKVWSVEGYCGCGEVMHVWYDDVWLDIHIHLGI